MNKLQLTGIAASVAGCVLACMPLGALADAADQATLKVYRLSAPGRQLTLSDLSDDALVLQQEETIGSADNAPIEQSFNLEGVRYSYTVSYAAASDYERSAVKLLVVDTTTAKPASQNTVDNLVLSSGKTTMVNAGAYVLAFTMDPPN